MASMCRDLRVRETLCRTHMILIQYVSIVARCRAICVLLAGLYMSVSCYSVRFAVFYVPPPS